MRKDSRGTPWYKSEEQSWTNIDHQLDRLRSDVSRCAYDPLFDAMMPFVDSEHRPGIVFEEHRLDRFLSIAWSIARVLVDCHHVVGGVWFLQS